MAYAVAAPVQQAVSSTTATITSAGASGGTGPYTYQWYRSTASGFTPGAGNIISGATSLTLNDSGLIPNTKYYYEIISTDTGNAGALADSSQLGVLTSPQSLSQNQFSLSPIIGQIDQRYPYDTTEVVIDPSQGATPLYAGMAVKIVGTNAGGVPSVVGCAADSDNVFGFINFDVKSPSFAIGSRCEISQDGNVMFLVATDAISAGGQVQLDLTTGGGVAAKVGASGANVVGWTMDQATAAGSIIRVHLTCPSFVSA
jgi:hypothetical protein